MTNGLSVRQEQGCGRLFYCAKKNRLCLSSYSVNVRLRECRLCLYLLSVSRCSRRQEEGSESVVAAARFPPEKEVTFGFVLMLSEGGAPISEFMPSAGGA